MASSLMRGRGRGRGGGGVVRKRSRFTHDQQVVADWFGGEEQGHNVEAPCALLSAVGVHELYEDPYDLEPGKNVSFDALPVGEKQRMLDGIARAEPAIRRGIITAEKDPTAIVLPTGHRHDVMPVPETAQRAVTQQDGALSGVASAHQAHLMGLPDYDGIELTFAHLRMVEHDGVHMSVQDLVDEVSTGHVHTVHVPGRADPHAFVVFDVDDRNTFFCAVALRVRGAGAGAAAQEECTAWSAEERERLGAIAGTFVGRAYFQCPCA